MAPNTCPTCGRSYDCASVDANISTTTTIVAVPTHDLTEAIRRIELSFAAFETVRFTDALAKLATHLSESIRTITLSVMTPAPLFGWWNAYRPTIQARAVHLKPIPSRPWRAQARCCRADRRRWKRRRFVQSLRRAA
jgi:hypothetical protein